METLFHGIMVWLACGMGTIVLVTLNEVFYRHTKTGKSSNTDGVSMLRATVGIIMLWPAFLVLTALAWRESESIVTFIEKRQWIITRWEYGVHNGTPFAIQYFNVDEERVVTHAVGSRKDQTIWCRVHPWKDEEPIPQGVLYCWQDALRAAKQDKHWRKLCLPANKNQLDMEWIEMKSRLDMDEATG
jgi:hypothetical protein